MKGVVFAGKRVISDKEREVNYQRHINNLHKVYDKDNNVQDTINQVQQKLDFQHKNRFNTMKYKQEQDKMKIQKENKKLLSALIGISENDKAVQQVQDAATLVLVQPSSKVYQKQMENYKIQNENFQLAYRMVNLPSVYTKKCYDAEYKMHKRRVTQLQKFQPEQSFDPFSSHFSSKSTHRSSSPLSRSSYMFMNSMSCSNKKVVQQQTHNSFYAPQSVSANKSFSYSLTNQNSPSLKQNESFNYGQSTANQTKPPTFTSNDRYYGEPIKDQHIQITALQNNLNSNRSQSTQSGQVNGLVEKNGYFTTDNTSVRIPNNQFQSPPKDFMNPPQTAVSVPQFCMTPNKLNRQEIKVVMKIFNFSLKIKPRTDDLNDHFYLCLKMAGNSKKNTPFFKYEMMSQIEFPFNFKIKNNRSPFSRKNSLSQQEGQSSPNSNLVSTHQIKCSLIQNKGNLQYLIGHFYLDIDASKKGINEVDTSVFHKDGDDQIVGQTKVILHVDLARNAIKRKILKQHQLSDTYSVPMDQLSQNQPFPPKPVQSQNIISINNSLTSSIQSNQGNLTSTVGIHNNSQTNSQSNQFKPTQQKFQYSSISNNSSLDAQMNNNYVSPQINNSYLPNQINNNHNNNNNVQDEQGYQSQYAEFGYQPKPDNYRQYKSSSVERRSQIKMDDRVGAGSKRQRESHSHKQQNNQKVQDYVENEDTEDKNDQNLGTIEEYRENKSTIRQKQTIISSHKTFRNTFLDSQIGQINKDIFLIKQNLQQTTSSQNQKDSLVKIHALKNRLKQIKVELGTLEQSSISFSPRRNNQTNQPSKNNKNSSAKKKVPPLHLNAIQKETI